MRLLWDKMTQKTSPNSPHEWGKGTEKVDNTVCVIPAAGWAARSCPCQVWCQYAVSWHPPFSVQPDWLHWHCACPGWPGIWGLLCQQFQNQRTWGLSSYPRTVFWERTGVLGLYRGLPQGFSAAGGSQVFSGQYERIMAGTGFLMIFKIKPFCI